VKLERGSELMRSRSTVKSPSHLDIRYWQNIPDHLTHGMFEALARVPCVDFDAFVLRGPDPDRIAMGWVPPEASYRVIRLDQTRRFRSALEACVPGKVHIMNLWGLPEFYLAVLWRIVKKSPLCVLAEPRFPFSRTYLNPAKSLLGRIAAGHALCAFPISERAFQEMEGFGFDRDKIFPYGYFPDLPFDSEPGRPWESDELLYVGQFIERKGLDTLVRAFAEVAMPTRLRLTLLGIGPCEQRLRELAARLGVEKRVSFNPPIPSSQVPRRIARARALVLPSMWDGWGVTVNEALSVGVPVITTDHAGARELVAASGAGAIVPASDNISLTATLARCGDAAMIRTWAECAVRYRQRISPGAVAPYVVDCIRYSLGVNRARPAPPWREPTPACEVGRASS